MPFKHNRRLKRHLQEISHRLLYYVVKICTFHIFILISFISVLFSQFLQRSRIILFKFKTNIFVCERQGNYFFTTKLGEIFYIFTPINVLLVNMIKFLLLFVLFIFLLISLQYIFSACLLVKLLLLLFLNNSIH